MRNKKNSYEEAKGLIVPQHFEPRWYQHEVLDAFSRGYIRMLLLWHRKTGKDLITIVLMFLAMMQRVGVYYYFFPKYTQGKKVLWEGTCEDGIRFLDRIPKELVKTRRENEMYMELKNGSIMRVVGADKHTVDDLVGAGPVGIAMSEYGVGEDYQKVLDVFMPVLQQNGGWLAVNGTPRGRNHYYDLYTNVLDMKDEWFVSSLQSISPEYHTGRYTGLISPEQLQLLRDQGTDEDTILQENGVDFTAGVKGSIFGKCISKATSSGRIKEFPLDDHVWVETFWDIGNADMTSIWFLQRIGAKRMWIDYYQNNHEDATFYINVLQNKGYKYRKHNLPHDARASYMLMPKLRPSAIIKECVKESGIGGTVKTHDRPKDKNALIESCKRQFTYYYFDSGRCREGIRLIEKYHRRYDSVRKVFTKEAIHDESSHCCDALMLECLTRHNAQEEYERQYEADIGYVRHNQNKSILTRFDRY